MISARNIPVKLLEASLVLFILSSIAYSKLLGLEKGSLCEGGICQLISECKTIEDFKKTKPDICAFQGKTPIICCPLVNGSSLQLSTSSFSSPNTPISYVSSARFKETTSGQKNKGVSSSTLKLFYSEIRYETQQVKKTEGSACEGGICKLINNCTTVTDIKKTRPDICDFESKTPIICCPFKEESSGLSPVTSSSQVSAPIQLSKEEIQPVTVHPQDKNEQMWIKPISNYEVGDIARAKCAEYNSEICKTSYQLTRIRRQKENSASFHNVIVGGTKSKPKDLTFMVLLGYGEENEREWECGGSLISRRWILSAAHCINHSRLGEAKWFRVGELVLDTDEDDASPLDFRIIEIVAHPGYGPEPVVYNDIALFKSEYSLGFSIYIRPICLQTYIPDVTRKAIAAGWGTTEFGGSKSSALLQVELDFVRTMSCKEQYGVSKLFPKGIDPYTQMCAGNPGKDTCAGDSGGPLFQNSEQPFQCLKLQVGITSFGRKCAVLPGVYTFLYNYTQWIEKIVWPNEIKLLETATPNTYDLLI